MNDFNNLMAWIFIILSLAISPRILRINVPFVSVVCKLLVAVGIAKIILFGYILKLIPPGMLEFVLSSNIKLGDMIWVFLEDAVHVLPILLLDKIGNKTSKILKYIFIPTSVLAFSFGHMYQGIQGFLVSLIYVPLVYHFAKKKGVGSMMVIHVVWDVIMFFVSLQIVGTVLK